MKGSENGSAERETAIGITGSSTSGKNTPATPIWPPHHKTRKTRKQSKQQLQALKSGKTPASQMETITFRDAVERFLPSAEVRYRSKPNSYKRIKTSLSSALVFFDKLLVNAIDAARVDEVQDVASNRA